MRLRPYLLFIIQVLIPALLAVSATQAANNGCGTICSCVSQPPLAAMADCCEQDTGQKQHMGERAAHRHQPAQPQCDESNTCPEMAAQADLTDLRIPLTADITLPFPTTAGPVLPDAEPLRLQRAPPLSCPRPPLALYIHNCSYLI